MLKIQLFGSGTAHYNDQPLSFRSVKVRALLAYLVAHANQPLRREVLATLLWEDKPEKQAHNNLRVTLTRLQKSLAPAIDGMDRQQPPLLDITRQTVQFNLHPVWCEVDTAVFEAALAACRSYPPGEWWRSVACIPHLETAVGVYRDAFLAGLHLDGCLEFDSWKLIQSEKYYQQAMVALEALSRHHLMLGNHEQALAYARRLLAPEPWRAQPHHLIMQTYIAMARPEMALRQFEIYRETAAAELGIDPDETLAALAAKLAQGQPAPTFAPTPSNNILGRREALSWLKAHLIDPAYPLITLYGPGGIGKTRLAQTAVAEIGHAFRDGAYFIVMPDASSDTAAVTVLGALSSALNLSDSDDRSLQQRVFDDLHTRACLLVLDNFEGVAPAADLILDLAAAAPQVTFLVTSRMRLGWPQEVGYPLRGLAVPPENAGPAARTYPSVQLFLRHARRLLPTFDPDPDELAQIAQLCRLTDGMPLALLLAASWIEEFSCAELVTAVQENLDILTRQNNNISSTDARQHSIEAVFEQSWRYLSTDEQRVLAQLSLFAGEFGRQAALAVTEAPPSTLSVLTAKCMLEAAGAGRYRLHPLLRRLAADRLTDATERETAVARFADWYAQFLRERQAQLAGAGQVEALADIKANIANIRHAWQQALTGAKTDYLQQMAGPLSAFYDDTGQHQLGLALFQDAAAKLADSAADTIAYATILLQTGLFLERAQQYAQAVEALEKMQGLAAVAPGKALWAWGHYRLGCNLMAQGELAEAETAVAQAEQIFLRLEDGAALAKVFSVQGGIAQRIGDFATARQKLEASLTLRREIGNLRLVSVGLSNFGFLLVRLGEVEAGAALLREGLALDNELGNDMGVVATLINLSLAYINQEAWQQAQDCLLEALPLARKIGDREGEAICLNNLGDTAVMQGNYAAAVAYLQDSLTIKREMGNRQGIAFSLMYLGRAYLGLRELVQADQALQEAETLALTLTLQPLWLACQVALAELHLIRNEVAAAQARLQTVTAQAQVAWKRTRQAAAALAECIQRL